MTQGDQQHPSGTTTAASSSYPEDAEAAERGMSSPPVQTDETVMEGRPHHHHHHHHHYHHQEQAVVAAADGDVKTLLHFVNLASSDIKAALDKSAPTRKSSVDNCTGKFLPKHLKQSPPPALTDDELYKGSAASPPIVAHSSHGFNSRRFISNLSSSSSNQSGSLHFSERLMASASLHRDHIQNSDLNLIRELTFGNIHRDTDPLLAGKRASNRYLDKHHVPAGREFTDMSTLNNEEGGKDRDNPVPLRKRRLPASFWQEPGRSENHKTSPGAMAGVSPLTMNAGLKFPLISSLAHGFTDTRPTSLDKNAIYPSNEHQCFPGQPFSAPALSNSINSDNYLNRTLSFPYSSICSCHQHTELYGYDHGPACATYAARHGETPGMLTPISPTGILSRWHVPSLAADRADVCHHPSSAPRVVKPIPTKSITSYPPRYHPVYT